MADREKVISAIQNCITVPKCRDCPWEECEEQHVAVDGIPLGLMRDTLKLLEEQEPVEPGVDVDTWICGNCGHRLEHQEMVGDNILFHEQYSYCPNCGRAVKWE